MKRIIILLLISFLAIGFINEVNAKNWVVSVTKKGGKATPCGIKYRKVSHFTGNHHETITCKGRGQIDCPTPTHTGGLPGIINVTNAVTDGASSGTLVDYYSLTISVFLNGEYNDVDKAASFDADITIFDTVEEMENYLNN